MDDPSQSLLSQDNSNPKSLLANTCNSNDKLDIVPVNDQILASISGNENKTDNENDSISNVLQLILPPSNDQKPVTEPSKSSKTISLCTFSNLARHQVKANLNSQLTQQTKTSSLSPFIIQCCLCFKWRAVPSMSIYERIRANLVSNPFTCEKTKEWNANICCNDPPDLYHDGSVVWAMDKEGIPETPYGWRRRIVVRGTSTSKFADVYYYTPCGKCLRSLNEIDRFLSAHPEYVKQGISRAKFSFSAPKSYDEVNAQMKRNARSSEHSKPRSKRKRERKTL